jgi:hypothetical protein
MVNSDELAVWGFLSGLYDIGLTCLFAVILSDQKKPSYGYAALYGGALILRILGGTRLILIKDIAVLLYVLFCRGRISLRMAGYVTVGLILFGTAVGVARGSGGASDRFGPAASILAEAGLSALTLNIAYDYYQSNAPDKPSLLQSSEFILESVAPTFLVNTVTDKKKLVDKVNPYNAVLTFGYDTSSPVGAMSLFASLIYVVGSPWLGTLLVVFLLVVVVKVRFNRVVKSAVLFSFALNALNFWRDPFEISLKIIVQTIIVLLFIYAAAYGFRRLPRAADRPAARINATD